jgi:thiol-disulfide isomerase/thioredoxin
MVTFAVTLGGCGNTGSTGAGAPAIAPAAASDSGWQQIPLLDLERRPVTLAKVLAGRPALVNLWAPWCERCKTELPELDRLSRRLDGCAVVVGVAVGEDVPHTAAFVHQHGLAYPQVIDEGFRLADALGKNRVPTTLVLDPRGAIVHVGPALDRPAIDALEEALIQADATRHCKDRLAGASWLPHEESWRAR